MALPYSQKRVIPANTGQINHDLATQIVLPIIRILSIRRPRQCHSSLTPLRERQQFARWQCGLREGVRATRGR